MNLSDRIQNIIDGLIDARAEAESIATQLRREDREGTLDLVEMDALPRIGSVIQLMDHLKWCIEKDVKEPFDFY